jgi:hypothetical protein
VPISDVDVARWDDITERVNDTVRVNIYINEAFFTVIPCGICGATISLEDANGLEDPQSQERQHKHIDFHYRIETSENITHIRIE